MKTSLFITVLLSFLLAVGGTAYAGPDDKGKGSAIIMHSNGSQGGAGSVELDLAVSAAAAHLANHEGDCLKETTDEAFRDYVVAMGRMCSGQNE